jgi:hypothetical protein
MQFNPELAGKPALWSATDWAEGGWNAEESVRLIEILKKGCRFNRCFLQED